MRYGPLKENIGHPERLFRTIQDFSPIPHLEQWANWVLIGAVLLVLVAAVFVGAFWLRREYRIVRKERPKDAANQDVESRIALHEAIRRMVYSNSQEAKETHPRPRTPRDASGRFKANAKVPEAAKNAKLCDAMSRRRNRKAGWKGPGDDRN